MKKPIEIVFPPETQIINTVPESIQEWRKYHLPDAKELIHQWPTGCMWEQWYDNPLSFLHLLHVEIEKDVHLSFSTNYHELYVIHLLHGGPLTLHQPKYHKLNQAIRLQEQEYAMTYLPKDEFEVQLPKGRYVVFYFVIKSSFLLKERHEDFRKSKLKPLIALRNHLENMVVSESLSLSSIANSKIHQYLRRPGETYLERTQNLINLTFYLFRSYLLELQLYSKQNRVRENLLSLTKTLIKNSIRDGNYVYMEDFERYTNQDFRELNRMFLKNEGLTIPKYITQMKLKESIRLLSQGFTVGQTANHLNLHPNYFRKIFQDKYGINPSKYEEE